MELTAGLPLLTRAAQAIAIKVMRREYSIRSCPSSSLQKLHKKAAIADLPTAIKPEAGGSGKA